jgi:hypothetical protein
LASLASIGSTGGVIGKVSAGGVVIVGDVSTRMR